MTYSFYTRELIEYLMAMSFADAGIWDLNDVYAWQRSKPGAGFTGL